MANRRWIPLADVDLSGNELQYVTEAVKSGWLTHKGPYVKRFEEHFRNLTGTESLACSSGTAALHLALLASGIGPGDEVIVPDLTFGATASVVKAVGARLILADVDEDWGIADFEHLVSPDTKAVIPVHLYGERCDMRMVMRIATKYKLLVIEDSCEAIDVQRVGHFACYSFFGNKHITTGEGGVISGPNLDRARLYRDGGFDGQYFFVLPGLNYRMTNLQAAVGCAQMERLEDILAARRRNAARYKKALKGLGEWLFVVFVNNPFELREKLKEEKIDTRLVFPPLHEQPPFLNYGEFPGAKEASTTGLCLPTGPHVTTDQIDFIIEKVLKYA